MQWKVGKEDTEQCLEGFSVGVGMEALRKNKLKLSEV